MIALRPLLLILLNYLVGWLVIHGYLEPSSKDVFVNEVANLVGYIIIVATSIGTIIHALKLPHAKVTEITTQTTSPITPTTTTTQVVKTNDFTQTTPITNSGTPGSN